MLIVAILGPGTLTPTLAAIVVSIPLFARVVRAAALSEREKEYVLASRALGSPPGRIMARTLLPAVLPVILVQAAIVAALSVQLEASLSFLGLGVRPPTPSLGAMLQSARGFLYTSPTYGIFPGLFLALITMAFLIVANALGARTQRGAEVLPLPESGARS
jgi:peptide/nickel transport system permease protein